MDFGYIRILILAVILAGLQLEYSLSPVPYMEDQVLKLSVHRALMFNQHGEELGSRKTFLRGDLSLPKFDSVEEATLHTGKVVLVPCVNHISYSVLKAFVARPVRGMLVVSCATAPDTEAAVSRLLTDSAVEIPVYFIAPQDAAVVKAQLAAVVEEEKQYEQASRLAVHVGDNAPALKPTSNIHSLVVRGVLHGKWKAPANADTATGNIAHPHVVLSAHFDTLDVAPSVPSKANAYAVPALAEVWRRLSMTTTDALSHPYSVTMLMGSSSHLNYMGTRSWLKKEGPRVKQYTMALSVEELMPTAEAWRKALAVSESAPQPPLYLHLHQAFANSEEGALFISKVEAASQATGVRVEMAPSKSRYRHNQIVWEHEVFNHHNIPGVSLSSLPGHDRSQAGVTPRPSADAPCWDDATHAAALERVMAARVDFLHRLVESLCNIRHDESAQWVGSPRFVRGLAEFAAHAVRSSATLEVTSSHPGEVPLQEDFAAEISGLLSSVASSPPSAVSAKVDVLGEELKGVPALEVFPSPTQPLVVYRGMTLERKAYWTAFTAVLLVVFALCSYRALPREADE